MAIGSGRQTYTSDGGSKQGFNSNFLNNPNRVTGYSKVSNPSPHSNTTHTNRGGNDQPRTVYVNNTPSAPAPAYSSGSDDVINMIKSLLEQQRAAAESAYKAQYEQQLAQNRQAFEANRNQINRNYMRGNRYLQNQYGDAISGTGLSNRARNYQNYQSNLASNQQNYTNNDANALSQFNQNKAGTYSTLANGWFNYVLPVYTNRQRNIDDYDYRRYIASL